ncbi:MAG: T9SS type A sorting domain-containing protein [Bacteroidia bacterium]|nr:T9SS type A sorting domain-containing protein [Bacteroidia bacterium]
MKNGYIFLLMFFLSLTATVFGQSQTYHYDQAKGEPGVTLLRQTANEVSFRYSLHDFFASPVEVKGEEMVAIQIPGALLPNDEGKPNLPGISHYIAVPQGATAKVTIHSKTEEVIPDMRVAPAPRIPLDTDNEPLFYAKDMKVYQNNSFYPAEPVLLSEPTTIRGVDVVLLGITPFRYNPVTHQLIVLRELEIEITFEGGSGTFGDSRYRNRYWDPILRDMLLNSSLLPKTDYSYSTETSKDETGYEYVILTPTGADFVAWADTISRFRNRQGIKTQVFTLDEVGGNTVNAIESFVNNAYSTWDIPPVAVLLLGDYGTDGSNSVVSPIWDDYCVSDNIYADVNGNSMPDVVFARITARNASELELMINKFLHYEKNPPVNPDFYDHPITALGWQTERWFQICSESVGGFMKNELGKNPVRINAVYDGNPFNDPWSTALNTEMVLNVFGPSGLGYIPASPAELGGWSGGNANMVNQAINNGAFILQHRDHGGENGWGEPDYSNSNIPGTTNTDLTFIFSINCLTGKYNWNNECFTEAFHRHTYGALGLIAASEVSYSFVNDTYVWGLFDNMWPEFLPSFSSTPMERGLLPAFGNAAGKYFLQQSQWPYNSDVKETTYNLFHHHGDAFLTLYSEVPQELTVNHDNVMISGAPTFTVAVEEGAFIALTHEGEIIASAVSEGGMATLNIPLQLPGTIIDIVITKTNYYRYENRIPVIPPDGAYIIKDDFSVVDEDGNGNLDYGENIVLNLTLKNVGNMNSNAGIATLTTENEYITFTDNTVDFPAIAASETLLLENAFSFTVADDVPDNTTILFMLETNDGGDEDWISYITVKAYAPELKALQMVINDYEGNNNGRLDPGETVDVSIFAINSGMSTAMETTALLTSTSPEVTINAGSVEIGSLGAQETTEAQFNISIAEEAMVGTIAQMVFEIQSGNYSTSKIFNSKIGLIVDNYETGDFSAFNYTFSGAANWIVTQGNAFEGEYAAQSGPISDQQRTDLILNYHVASDDSIHFMYKVSSENSYDYLRFFIDGTQLGAWSGEQDWSQASYPVSEGEHEFRWAYEKDYSVANGSDCGWIDYLLLPAELRMTAYAGADMELCSGEVCPLNGAATLFTSVLWSTSGDGIFDDPTALTTHYHPGENDLAYGSVELTLTVSGSGDDISDNLTVTIHPELVLTRVSLEDPFICNGGTYTLLDFEALNYAALQWQTDGDGTFDDAALLNATYTPGENDLAAGMAGLTLTATALGGCTDGEAGLTLTIHPLPTAVLTGTTQICSGDSTLLTIDLTGNAPWIVINGADETMEISESPWSDYVTPTETTEYTLLSVTDFNGCTNSAEGVATITVNSLPVVSLGDDREICHNHVILLDAGFFTNADYAWSTGETTQTIEVDSSGVGFSGSKEISVTVTSQEGCAATDTLAILIKDCTGIDESGDLVCTLYPNPTNERIYLTLNTTSKKVNFRLVNAVGKMVMEEKNIPIEGSIQKTFDSSNLNAGFYYLIIEGENGRLVRKIVIE